MPSDEPAWSYDLNESVPVLSLHRWLGIREMVYLAGIRRYLLVTWRLHKDFSGADGTTGWLQFSGSWSPTGQKAGYYRSSVRQFRLRLA